MAGSGADDLDGVGVKDLGAMIKVSRNLAEIGARRKRGEERRRRNES